MRTVTSLALVKHYLAFFLCLFFIVFAEYASAQALGKKEGIHGLIIDAKTGEKISGVVVVVTGSTNTYSATTDIGGKFYVKLPPGTYAVKISSLVYNTKSYVDIIIKPGEVFTLNTQLTEKDNTLKDVEVVSSADEFRNASTMVLMQQKKAIAITDIISSDFITQTPDRTTADALKRMSGVTVADDKFALIRGLSERYNTAFINGIPLASSESDKKAFALDLIPTQLLDNISVVKTATPDLPGDFSGGLIRLTTLEVPLSNSFFVNVGSEVNTMTTFKNFLSSPDRGIPENFGLLNTNRQVPGGALPTDQASQLDPFKDGDKITQQTNLFNNNFSPISKPSALPNMIFQMGGSKRFNIKKNVLGIVGMVSYNSYNLYTPYDINYLRPPSDPNAPSFNQGSNYSYESYKTSVQSTAILNLSYNIRKHTQLFFKNLLVVGSEDETITGSGVSATGSNAYAQNDISYIYRTNRLYSTQLGARHTLGDTRIKFEYTFGYNNISRSLPDYKRLIYTSSYDINNNVYQQFLLGVKANAFNASYDPELTGRYFSTMNDNNFTASYHFAIPIDKLKSELKIGGLHTIRNRDFAARNYLFTYTDGSSPDLTLGRDSIFMPGNVGADKLYLWETTKKADTYSASSALSAFFLMMDSKITSRLRAAYGVRMERYNQKLNSYNINTEVNIDTTVIDILPSANIIYALNEKTNLRVAYFASVSRPEFREIAPLSFFDITTLSVVTGNPNLVRTRIQNFDLKYEWYPAMGSMISVNPFYKTFENPIESYNLNIPSDVPKFTYANFKGGFCTGVEFDFRINLRKADQWLKSNFMKDISWFMNYAIIYSSADLDKYDRSSVFYFTPDYTYRPLQGQSPYVLNSGILYSNHKYKIDISLTGNKIGRRIDYVASNGKFIIWENPRTVIDFSIAKVFAKRFQARFIIANLIPQDRILYQDADFENTVKFSNNLFPFSEQHYDASNSKDLLNYRYKYGSTYSLAIGYTF